MAVMRSVQYVPGNNEKMVAKAPSIPADIITLDLEDSVPPAEKARAREVVAANLVNAGSGGAEVYVRINNWETEMTNDDLEAIVTEGLTGVTLAKCGHPANVKRLDWKLEELEQRRGLEVGAIKASLLLETAKGIIFAYESCVASPRVASAIVGAVDFTKDMRVKLTPKVRSRSTAAGTWRSQHGPPASWRSMPPLSPTRTWTLSRPTCVTVARWATRVA